MRRPRSLDDRSCETPNPRTTNRLVTSTASGMLNHEDISRATSTWSGLVRSHRNTRPARADTPGRRPDRREARFSSGRTVGPPNVERFELAVDNKCSDVAAPHGRPGLLDAG